MQQQRKEPTTARALEIADKRVKLGNRIGKFTQRSHAFIPPQITGLVSTDPDDEADEYEENYRHLDDDTETTEQGQDRPVTILVDEPERQRLPLPSVLGKGACSDAQLHDLLWKELELRQGQANEALAGVRMAVGEKSFYFRKKLRQARGNAQVTRSWDAIHTTTRKLMHQRWKYSRARKAMIALGADKALLDKYQVLQMDDLKVNTAITQPNAYGQRKMTLPWIWTVAGGLSKDEDNSEIMEDCKFPVLLFLTGFLITRSEPDRQS